jgi:ComF family protein
MRHNPMAERFNALLQGKIEKFTPYVYSAALFFYKEDSKYRHIPQQLKYHGNTAIGRHFGKMLGARLIESAEFKNADLIVPVPLHWSRKWKRGYNQAEILAQGIAMEMRIPVRTDLLRRIRRTVTQTRLGIEAKGENVAGAFCANIKKPDTIKGIRHVILIDDVFTTGSTMAECFMALRQVLPKDVRISVATLCFAGA